MKQSFIRQGTCVVCTNMTCGKPQKVGVTRAERYVMNTKAEEPLLNVDDRKISASFGCRNPQSFYAGLCALCVGPVSELPLPPRSCHARCGSSGRRNIACHQGCPRFHGRHRCRKLPYLCGRPRL